MDLRARMELLKALTAKLAETSGLPEMVKQDLISALEGALPPRDAIEPDSCDTGADKIQHNRESGYTFAARVQDLWQTLDRFKPRSPRSPQSDGFAEHTEGLDSEPEPDGLLALTGDEDLWSRTKLICRELVTGWSD